MKEIDFNGFVIYRIYSNNNILVNHVFKSNDINAFNEAIETIYAEWNRHVINVKDIILLTLPCVNPYTIENPIFRASTIGTDKEFGWESFKEEYYK